MELIYNLTVSRASLFSPWTRCSGFVPHPSCPRENQPLLKELWFPSVGDRILETIWVSSRNKLQINCGNPRQCGKSKIHWQHSLDHSQMLKFKLWKRDCLLAKDEKKMGNRAGHSQLGWDNKNGSSSCEDSLSSGSNKPSWWLVGTKQWEYLVIQHDKESPPVYLGGKEWQPSPLFNEGWPLLLDWESAEISLWSLCL